MNRRFTKLKSYNDCAIWLDHARFPDKGRKVCTSLRLFKDGDNYRVERYGSVVCYFHPDDTLTLGPGWRGFSLHYYLPLATINTGRRRIDRAMLYGLPKVTDAGYQRWAATHPSTYIWLYLRSHAPIAYEGLKFDLKSGETLNARPELDPKNFPKQAEIPEKAREWRKAIKQMRMQLHAQHKLGLFDADQLPEITTHTEYWTQLNAEAIAAALKESVTTDAFRKALCNQRPLNRRWIYGSHPNPTAEHVMRAYKHLIDRTGRWRLKQHFGVYSQIVTN